MLLQWQPRPWSPDDLPSHDHLARRRSTLRLYSVALTPGWTYVIKSNGEGTSSRVALQFTETATGQRVDFLTEFGKTKIS